MGCPDRRASGRRLHHNHDRLTAAPLWQWADGRVRVATGDIDQLRFIGATLARFDQMTAEELHAYLHD